MFKPRPYGLSKLLAPQSRLLAGTDDVTALLVSHGFIKPASSGSFDILPLGLRVQAKIEAIIREHLTNIGAAEFAMASLVDPSLWRKSGRLTAETDSQFLFTENHKRLLQPTGEEQVSSLLSAISSYRQLPVSLYQTTRKYRNELRPRGGLLRTREFVMNDLYTADTSKEAAMQSYNNVRSAYNQIFTEIGVPFISVQADSGTMGGSYSHEYHYSSPEGEDLLVSCHDCGASFNIECVPTASELTKEEQLKAGAECMDCGSSKTEVVPGIEVGHTFYLGTKYSKIFGVNTNENNTKQPAEMGCYGIGVTRLISAIACATRDDFGLNWPASVAAAPVFVVSPSPGLSETIASELSESGIETLFDDGRASLGMAMSTARQAGWPFTVIAGQKFKSDGMVDVEIRKRAGDDKTQRLITIPKEELPEVLKKLIHHKPCQ